MNAGADEHFATSIASDAGLTFRWDFGDGTVGEGAAPTHQYAKTGHYRVTLAVANTAEELRTATWTVDVGNFAVVTGLDCSLPDAGGWCWEGANPTGHRLAEVAFADGAHAWAIGTGGMLLESTDAGVTWTVARTPAASSTDTFLNVRFRDAQHGVVTGLDGKVLLTADGGATWAAAGLGTLQVGLPYSLAAYKEGELVLSAGGSGVTSTDEGKSWTPFSMIGQTVVGGSDCFAVWGLTVQHAAGCGTVTTQTTLPLGPDQWWSYDNVASFNSDQQGKVIGRIYDYNHGQYAAIGWGTQDAGATWFPFTPHGLDTILSNGPVLQMTSGTAGWAWDRALNAATTTDGARNWTPVPTSAYLAAQPYASHDAGLLGDAFWQSSGNRLSMTTDQGATWQDITVPAEATANGQGPVALHLVRRADATHVVVLADDRAYATVDGGATWTRTIGPDPRDKDVTNAANWFLDANNGVAVTGTGAYRRTTDGGHTWTRTDYAVANPGPVALYFGSATDGWMLLNGGLSHSTDAGATWSLPVGEVGMTGLSGMSWGDETHAWAWNNDKMWSTADAGKTWSAVTLPQQPFGSLYAAAMTGPLTGVVSTYYSSSTTSDGGLTWVNSSGAPQGGRYIHARGHVVWNLGYQTLARSDDDGASWHTVSSNLPGTPNAISFADDLHGWAVGSNGLLVHTVDGGATWTQQSVGNDLVLASVTALDAATAWIQTSNGEFLVTATAGH